MKLAIMFAFAVGVAGHARADSVGSRPDDRASIQHADSVVAGVFTGATSRRITEQNNAFDASGRPYTARIAQVVHELTVTEHLDGATTPATISINVPGALAVPAPGRRVVIGVRLDGASPDDGYNLLYGRALEADSDARLAELRTWVLAVRAPAPVDPQALVEAVGMHEAELRPDEPVAGDPVGLDDPAGPARPSWSGPPRAAPQVIEPMGDPRHPPEPGALAEADEPSSPEAPSRLRAAAPAPGQAAPATAAAPVEHRRRWPYVAGALVLVAVVFSRRRR